MVLSPDGTRVVYVSQGGQLYIRQLDQLEAVPLRGGVGVNPFFSPDGNWVGFRAAGSDDTLKRVSILGGTPATLVEDLGGIAGATWGPDDTIVFATGTVNGLFRISAAGGERRPLTELRDGEIAHRWPEFLPGGEAVLFTVVNAGATTENMETAVLDLNSGERTTLVSIGSNPRYAAGHIVYGEDGTLRAVPFDLDRLVVTGDPIPVLEGVITHDSGATHFSVGGDGSLVYITGEAGRQAQRTLTWVDRNGEEEPIGLPPRAYNQPQLSPDGRRIAVDTPGGDNDVFLYDLDTQVEEQFTFAPDAQDQWPLWSPDGSQILFSSDRHGGSLDLYVKLADGSGTAERVPANLPTNTAGTDWVDDGETVVFGGSDIHVLRLGTDSEPETLLETDDIEAVFTVSPNGRWIAYKSNESGEQQIYVRPFPDVSSGGQRLISDAPGATDPLWGHDGRELFYLTPDTAMAVPVETEDTFQRGTPRRLFSMAPYYQGANLSWDLSADGQRFLMVTRDVATGEDAPSSEIIVVENWIEELKGMFPPVAAPGPAPATRQAVGLRYGVSEEESRPSL